MALETEVGASRCSHASVRQSLGCATGNVQSSNASGLAAATNFLGANRVMAVADATIVALGRCTASASSELDSEDLWGSDNDSGE